MEGFKTSFGIFIFVTTVSSIVSSSPPLYRLLDIVVPTFYDLSLTVEPELADFAGTVKITFDVTEENHNVNYFYLHADIRFVAIRSVVLNEDVDCSIFESNEVDILCIICSRSVTGSGNSLTIEYVAKFSTEDGYGMVKSTYLDQGEEQVLIESSFKPTYARRTFPCMDEPELTANFSVRVTHPSEYSVISNSPVVSETQADGSSLQTTVFAVTSKISTYLVSILVSKLQAARTTGDERFKVFTRSEVANLTAKVVGKYYSEIMAELNDYIGVPYESLNGAESYHVAVPDYTDGVSNFGMFTYREAELLDEGEKTTNRVTQDIITAIAYKSSHQWYGGELSTRWWSDIWANEAVATYLKYVIPNKVNEELDLMNQFVVEVTQKAMQYDAMPFAQPLSSKESEVNVDEDIESKLNAFSYLKGASVLHMLSYVLGGEEEFRSSLQYHLTQRNDFSTNGNNILKDLAESQDKSYLYDYFEAWAFSSGFPLITAQIEERGSNFEVAGLTRKRFVYPVEDMADLEDTYAVPMTDTSETYDFNVTFYDIFYVPGDEMSYFFGMDRWIMFNVQGGGFYRVNYEEELWKRLINNGLKNDEERSLIHVLNRAQLVDDIFNIARIGEVSYVLAFELADYLKDETEYYPWYSAFNAFSYLLGKMDDGEVEANLKSYLLNLMDNIIHIPNGTEPDDVKHIDALKNVMVLDWACYLGHLGCAAYAAERFQYFKESQASLDDYNFRGVIFCNGIRRSDNVAEDWDFLWGVYTASSSVHEQNDALNALGCAEDKSLLKSYLLKTITANSGIKKQDVLTVFKSIFSSSMGLEAAKEFLEGNLALMDSDNGMNILSEMVYGVAEKLVTDEQVQWLTNLLGDDVFNEYTDVITSAKGLASVNIYWKKHYQAQIIDIFPPSSDSTTTSSSASTTTTTTERPTTVSSTTTTGSCEGVVASIITLIIAVGFVLNVC